MYSNSNLSSKASSSTTAQAKDLLVGKSITINGSTLTGSMPNNGATGATINPGGSYTIPAGYTTGGTVKANPNQNSGTYTYGSGSTGGTVDMGVNNTYRYVNASNVYNKGIADADARVNTNSANYQSGYNAGLAVYKSYYDGWNDRYNSGYSNGRASVTLGTREVYQNTITETWGASAIGKSGLTSITVNAQGVYDSGYNTGYTDGVNSRAISYYTSSFNETGYQAATGYGDIISTSISLDAGTYYCVMFGFANYRYTNGDFDISINGGNYSITSTKDFYASTVGTARAVSPNGYGSGIVRIVKVNMNSNGIVKITNNSYLCGAKLGIIAFK